MEQKELKQYENKEVKIYLHGSARLSGKIISVGTKLLTMQERDGQFKLSNDAIAAIGECKWAYII